MNFKPVHREIPHRIGLQPEHGGNSLTSKAVQLADQADELRRIARVKKIQDDVQSGTYKKDVDEAVQNSVIDRLIDGLGL